MPNHTSLMIIIEPEKELMVTEPNENKNYKFIYFKH